METNKLTVRLAASEIRFIKDFARRHGITVTDVIHRYFTRLQAPHQGTIHSEIAKLTGTIPSNIDAIAEHQRHLHDKHR